MIEVKNLVKKYGNHIAVDDLSFTVEKGQIYGFLGPNGAGKSTTMNMITGYLAATSGSVTINGHDIVKEPEAAKKSIGYLPELPPLYMDMTVYEYLLFAAELKGVLKTERKRQTEDAMEMTGITDMKNRLIKNLSKGYRQRVGLAQAVLGFPEVIILDEPTVGLDPKQIIEIRDLIKSLGKEHTIILSSHILSEVSAVCDHIMIISKGKLVASDTPENLGNRMKEKSCLNMTIKGTQEEITDLLSNMTTVEHFEIHPSAIALSQDVEIKTKNDEDIREQLFYRCAEHKKAIMKMQLSDRSLEDVFLELTEDEGSAEQIKDEILSETEKTVSKEEAVDHDSSI